MQSFNGDDGIVLLLTQDEFCLMRGCLNESLEISGAAEYLVRFGVERSIAGGLRAVLRQEPGRGADGRDTIHIKVKIDGRERWVLSLALTELTLIAKAIYESLSLVEDWEYPIRLVTDKDEARHVWQDLVRVMDRLSPG